MILRPLNPLGISEAGRMRARMIFIRAFFNNKLKAWFHAKRHKRQRRKVQKLLASYFTLRLGVKSLCTPRSLLPYGFTQIGVRCKDELAAKSQQLSHWHNPEALTLTYAFVVDGVKLVPGFITTLLLLAILTRAELFTVNAEALMVIEFLARKKSRPELIV